MISDEKLIEILNCYKINGLDKTLESFAISGETLNRYVRYGRKKGLLCKKDELISKVVSKLSEKDLEFLLKNT